MKPLDAEDNYQRQKRLCCQTSAVGLLMSDRRTRRVAPAGLRRGVGLLVLVAAHLYCLAWGGLVTLFVPRYRFAVRFHCRYFKDVLAKALRPPADAGGHNP
jgi:hypothetical protein